MEQGKPPEPFQPEKWIEDVFNKMKIDNPEFLEKVLRKLGPFNQKIFKYLILQNGDPAQIKRAITAGIRAKVDQGGIKTVEDGFFQLFFVCYFELISSKIDEVIVDSIIDKSDKNLME